MTSKIAIIEAKPSRNNYEDLFEGSFEFDKYHLTSDTEVKKVLKKHVDININLDAYDWVILVGSEPFKFYTKNNSITEFSGKLVDEKFLPVINPAMLAFKPDAKKSWESSRDSIIAYVNGTHQKFDIDESNFIGIQDTAEAVKYLKAALEAPAPYVAIDTETSGLFPRDGYVLGISISYKKDAGAYIDTDCIDEECEDLFQEIFDLKTIVFHNAKFDVAMLEYHFGFKFPSYEDTMLQHYMLEETPGTHSLKQLALQYTIYGDYEKELHEWIAHYCKENRIKKEDFNWSWIPFDVMFPYASKDAVVTFILYEFFKSYLDRNTHLTSVYKNILIPGSRFLTDIQDNGVPFDIVRLTESQELMTHEIQEAVDLLNSDENVKKFAEDQGKPFNPNSVIQLRKLLFDYINLPPTGRKTEKGEDTTDAEALEKLSKLHGVPNLIIDVRQKSKIKNTYLDKIIPQLDLDGRLRTNFNIHTTTSGRLSSSGKLNMQQIPRDNPIIKGCIKARPGRKIVSIDLVTAEMYVAAVLSGDKDLQRVFRSGENFHSTIAHKVFKLDCALEDVAEFYSTERQAAKAVSFGILYGAGPKKVAESVRKDGGSMSVSEAAEVIDDYFKAFPELKTWIDDNISFIKRNGFAYSFFGRKRRLGNVKSVDTGVQGHEIRSGLNFLVQSVASDINLLGGIDANNEIKSKGLDEDMQIFALVHDSLLAEVVEDKVEEYTEIALRNLQKDRGLSIPECPIGCDVEVDDDYSFGKFEKLYAA